MKKLLLLSLAVTLVSLTACKKEKEDQLGLNTNVEDISSDINVTFQRDFSQSVSMILRCETTKNYPCVNYPIVYKRIVQNNNISVEFLGVSIEEFCLTAIGPATCNVPLEDLTDGKYNLLFYSKGQQYKYEIMINDGRYTLLSEPHDSGVIFLF